MSDKTREEIEYERAILDAQILRQDKVGARLLGRLNNSLRATIGELEKFGNPIGMLTDSLNKMDSTNRDALKIGVTNTKLSKMVSKNSSVLSDNLVSNQALQEAIIQNFGQGVRFQTEGLMALTTEMIATGQDVQSLGNLNSDLALATDNSTGVVTRLAEVNKDASDKYGISNEKLINTLQTLKSSLDKASFFGDEAVESLGVAAQELKGRAGGKNIEGALATMSELLVGGLDTIKAASVLGIQGDRESMARGGGITADRMAEIADEFKRVSDSMGGGSLGLDYTAKLFEMSKAQVAGMLQLAKVAHNDSGIQEGLKKTTDETYNTIENVNARATNFYDKTAMSMLAVLGSIPLGAVGNTAQIVAAIGGMGGPVLANRRSQMDEEKKRSEETEQQRRKGGGGTNGTRGTKGTPPLDQNKTVGMDVGGYAARHTKDELEKLTPKPSFRDRVKERYDNSIVGKTGAMYRNIEKDMAKKMKGITSSIKNILPKTTFDNLASKAGRGLRGGAVGMALNAASDFLPGMTKEDGTSRISGISTGLSIGAGIAPFLGPFAPLSVGIGGAVGLLSDLVDLSGEGAEREKEKERARKQKEAQERALAATRDMQNANIFAGYIRSRMDLSYGPETIKELRNIKSAVQKGPKSKLTRSTAQIK